MKFEKISVRLFPERGLQSIRYPPDAPPKHIVFKHPISGEMLYYRQLGPIYGENSAPKHWENTLFGFLTECGENGCGLVRGKNEPCVLSHHTRELTVIVYVDDILVDGAEGDIKWFFGKLDSRFDCKEEEWLTPESPLDFLGIDIQQDEQGIYLSMGNYVEKMLRVMNMAGCKPRNTPIVSEITNMEPLDEQLRKLFMTGVGCVGWLVNTARPDASLAHSRISQHLAKPTVGAWEALQHLMRYFQGTKNACIFQPYGSNEDGHGWSFFSDSDFAGNPSTENKRRSQNGFVAMVGNAPISWYSKVASSAFAHPDIGEAHADISVGAAEVYAAANATLEMLSMSYMISEMGEIPFPKPMVLQMDNTTAEIFANNTAARTKLKHIDVRQNWVQCLRDSSIVIPKHVPSKENLADLFTKILDGPTFYNLSRQILLYRE